MLSIPFLSFSAYVEFIAKVEDSQVKAGKRFRVVYSLNTRGNNFSAPPFIGFNILSGPNQSTSMQWINGKVTHNVEYSFIVSGRKPGRYKIKPATIMVQGKMVRSNEIDITVLKGDVELTTTKKESAKNNKKLFISQTVSKKSFYIGEPIVLKNEVFSKINMSRIYNQDFKDINGFWIKDIPIKELKTQNTTIEGVGYVTALIRKQILIAQEEGKKTILPFSLTCLAQGINTEFGNSIFDDFFNRAHQEEYFLKSNRLNLNVKKLPSKNKPKNFGGAVGKYSIKSKVDNLSLDVNDGTTLTLLIKGEGNIELFDNPVLKELKDFEIFEPQTETKANPSGNTIKGKREIKYLITPKYPGKYAIPEILFSYFDPKQKKYNTISTKPIVINVTGVKKTANIYSNNTNSQSKRESINYIDSDIRYLRKNITYSNFETTLYNTPIGYMLLSIPFILFFSSLGYRKYKIYLYSDITALKNKRANKIARKYLDKSKKLLDSRKTEGFYEAVIKGLLKYLDYKAGLSTSEFNKENVVKILKRGKVKNEDINKTIKLFSMCEQSRYFSNKNINHRKIYEEANNVINILEKSYGK